MMKITVCIGSSCHIKGSRQVVTQLQQLIAQNNLGDKVELFDGAILTTEQTRQALEQADMLYDGPGEVVIENSLPGDRMLKLSRKLAGLE